MNGIEINNDNREAVKSELKAALARALEICGQTAERYAKENITAQKAVDTGNLRNSITHIVDDNAVYIGTNVEYAPYIELGTGKYNGGGRQEPWVYKDSNGNWHRTDGQRPRPYLKPAAEDHASEYRNIIKTELSS